MSNSGEEEPPRNPLRKYLPCADCRKSWKPHIYEFKKDHLVYNGNAFDIFIPEMRFHHQEAMAELEELQKIPTDVDRFFAWIADSVRRTSSNDFGLNNSKEHFELFVPEHEYMSSRNNAFTKPIRRAYSLNQLDQNVSNLRSSLIGTEIIKTSCDYKYFCDHVHCLGACDEEDEPEEIHPPPSEPSPLPQNISWEFEWNDPM